MVSDLTEGTLAGHPLEGLMFGGAPAHSTLPGRAGRAFPNAVMWVVIYSGVRPKSHYLP
jgi:hypothetical protein